jgi:NhaA family Na+:H+ antiporter
VAAPDPDLADRVADLSELSDPPGVWPVARRAAKAVLAPVERFLAVEASAGLLLMAAAGIALLWANSPWYASYEALWHMPLGLRLGPLAFERDLHFWINDGLMTIFFFVVGLEIRREAHGGELSELRRAALPLVAAFGGMIAPAAIYAALNHGHVSVRGWGVPMATDIAFAVGVFALLGKRVRPALRILLLALAVIDDVGAIVVIAIFYSGGLAPLGFLIVGAGIAGVLVMRGVGVRSPWLYVVPGAVVWAGAYVAGVHPTLAGVALGLLTPARAWLGSERFVEHASANIEVVRGKGPEAHEILPQLDAINVARREAVAPVESLQHALHPWVAYGVMPIFALSNAGVALGGASFAADGTLLFAGVVAGLVLGKPLGILGLSWLATRLGLAALPRGVRWRDIGVLGLAAGIGFTMALFVAQLAFGNGAQLETAKLAILCASGLAAILAFASGVVLLRGETPADAAQTEAEAEASTET